MAYMKIKQGGQGGKKGHSNMSHWTGSFLARIFLIRDLFTPLLKDNKKKLGIVVWNGKWDDVKTDTATRYLIIYHELLHVVVDDKSGNYKLRPHDVEDFKTILAKSGLNWENTSWIMDEVKKGEEQK